MDERKLQYVEGDDLRAQLENLLLRHEEGDPINCVFRIFHKDGTWKDVALADTEEKRAELLAEFLAFHKQQTQ